MNIIGHSWFTNFKGTIGIVVYDNGFGKIKSKISVVSGKDMNLDIKTVINSGSAFSIIAAYFLLNDKCLKMEDFEKIGIDLKMEDFEKIGIDLK